MLTHEAAVRLGRLSRLHRNGAVGSGDATPAKVIFEVQTLAEQLGRRGTEYRVRQDITSRHGCEFGNGRGKSGLGPAQQPGGSPWIAVVVSVVLLDGAIYSSM